MNDVRRSDLLHLAWLSAAFVLLLVLYGDGCLPMQEPGAVEKSAKHNMDLSACRKWSESFRDAGPDAEWSAYTQCADKADKR